MVISDAFVFYILDICGLMHLVQSWLLSSFMYRLVIFGNDFSAQYLTVYCSCLTDSLNISHLLKIFTYTDKPSVIYMRRKSSKFVRNAREARVAKIYHQELVPGCLWYKTTPL